MYHSHHSHYADLSTTAFRWAQEYMCEEVPAQVLLHNAWHPQRCLEAPEETEQTQLQF